MDNDQARRMLTEAAWTDQKVKITVWVCQYKCCGGGWQPRVGYVQAYEGLVMSLGPDDVLLELPNDIGKRADVVATLSDLLSVDILVD